MFNSVVNIPSKDKIVVAKPIPVSVAKKEIENPEQYHLCKLLEELHKPLMQLIL